MIYAAVAELADLPAGRQARWTQNMKHFVYAIKSIKSNYIYVGLTKNVGERIHRHNIGREKTTKAYRPFQLIYAEKFPDRKEARQQERYLKSGCGKEFLKGMKSNFKPEW